MTKQEFIDRLNGLTTDAAYLAFLQDAAAAKTNPVIRTKDLVKLVDGYAKIPADVLTNQIAYYREQPEGDMCFTEENFGFEKSLFDTQVKACQAQIDSFKDPKTQTTPPVTAAGHIGSQSNLTANPTEPNAVMSRKNAANLVEQNAIISRQKARDIDFSF